MSYGLLRTAQVIILIGAAIIQDVSATEALIGCIFLEVVYNTENK